MLRRTVCRYVCFMKVLSTPNPNSRSFCLPDTTFDSFLPDDISSCEIPHVGLAILHPLASALFDQYEKEVSSLLLSQRAVTVTKYHRVQWEECEDSLNSFFSEAAINSVGPLRPHMELMRYYCGMHNDLVSDPEHDTELVQCIKELLREQVRPMVIADGGDIKLIEVDEESGIVMLQMMGACRSCPSSQGTLKHGIERILKHFLPEITEVREVKVDSNGRLTTTPRQIQRGGNNDTNQSLSPVAAVYLDPQLKVTADTPLVGLDGNRIHICNSNTRQTAPKRKVQSILELEPRDDDFEAVHKSEKSVYREICAAEKDRQQRLRHKLRPTSHGRLSLEALMEPDGD